MAGVNTVLRGIGAILSLFVVIFTGWTAVMLYDPITSALTLPQLLFYAGIGISGVTAVVLGFSHLDKRWNE